MNNIFSYIIFPKTISGNFTSTNSDDPHQFMILQMFSVTLPQTRLLFFKEIGQILIKKTLFLIIFLLIGM